MFLMVVFSACGPENPGGPEYSTVPEHDWKYGIYIFELETGAVELLYSSENSIHRIHENNAGTKLVFQEDFGNNTFRDSEICLINTDGTGYQRLTDNSFLDAYPSWSPDGSSIIYLSWPDYPDSTLDIFTMDSSGSNPFELYDSGYNDADCCWIGSKVVFTRESQIWLMNDDGTNAIQVTDFELAGQQGSADLPFGDYDPRMNPDGSLISFDRLVNDLNPSGNWNFYTINCDGTGETPVTDTGWQQYMAEWSHSGNQLIFTVASINGEGIYDMYTMASDGSNQVDITPESWPSEFLCTHGVFSCDDSKIYFAGEWWSNPGVAPVQHLLFPE